MLKSPSWWILARAPPQGGSKPKTSPCQHTKLQPKDLIQFDSKAPLSGLVAGDALRVAHRPHTAGVAQWGHAYAQLLAWPLVRLVSRLYGLFHRCGYVPQPCAFFPMNLNLWFGMMVGGFDPLDMVGG